MNSRAGNAAELTALAPLAKSNDPADLLLEVITYDTHGVAEAALATHEKLAAKRPNVVRYQ